jgi:hypothetical protein
LSTVEALGDDMGFQVTYYIIPLVFGLSALPHRHGLPAGQAGHPGVQSFLVIIAV